MREWSCRRLKPHEWFSLWVRSGGNRPRPSSCEHQGRHSIREGPPSSSPCGRPSSRSVTNLPCVLIVSVGSTEATATIPSAVGSPVELLVRLWALSIDDVLPAFSTVLLNRR